MQAWNAPSASKCDASIQYIGRPLTKEANLSRTYADIGQGIRLFALCRRFQIARQDATERFGGKLLRRELRHEAHQANRIEAAPVAALPLPIVRKHSSHRKSSHIFCIASVVNSAPRAAPFAIMAR